MIENWKEMYLELLTNYLKDENELSLYRVSLLGKEMIENGISPEEVLESHLAVLKQIVMNIGFNEWVPCFYKSFNLLIELMTAFGVVYREYVELKDELKKAFATQVAYKRLKFYVDEMEFVTSRLASMNEELDRRIIELSSLQKISKAINSVLEFDQLLKSITSSLSELVEYSSCSIMLFGKDNKLMIKSAVRKDSKIFSEHQIKLHLNVGEYVLQNREVFLVSDISRDNRFDTHGLSIRSLLALPMLVEKEVVGIIAIDSDEPDKYTQDTTRLLSIVAAQAGMAIKNSYTYEEIKKISMTDGLTGLYNHRYFYERLKTEIDWARHYNTPVSLLMVDIDNFKEYNDNYGHTSGDRALKKIAEILLRSTRQEDVVARYGGEEFAVILISVNADTAGKIADRIRQDIMNEALDGDNSVRKLITVSIGGASFPVHAQNVKQLVDEADKAMYHSKQAGKNCVTFSLC